MILYVSDLDGTLLNSSAKISSNSTKLLNEALNNNISFTIATARTPATIVPILKNINLNMPVIAMNGCSIYDLKNNKYIHTISINSNLISMLQKLISSEGLNPFIYTLKDNHLYVYHNKLTVPCQVKFYDERKNSSLKTFIEAPLPSNSQVLYFTIMDSKEKIDSLFDKLKDIPEISAIKYSDTYNKDVYNLEIYNYKASKSNAINYLKNTYDFDTLVTFGDNLNDIPMFNISDHSCAVENAACELKEIASEIIGLNTDDSVAKYILNHSNK